MPRHLAADQQETDTDAPTLLDPRLGPTECLFVSACALIHDSVGNLLLQRVTPDAARGVWSLPEAVVGRGDDPRIVARNLLAETVGQRPDVTFIGVHASGEASALRLIYRATVTDRARTIPGLWWQPVEFATLNLTAWTSRALLLAWTP